MKTYRSFLALGLLLVANSTMGQPITTNTASRSARATGPFEQRVQLSVRSKLFADLAEEHSRRADDARRAEKEEEAAWETNLANEFRGRATAADKSMAELAATVSKEGQESAPPGTEPVPILSENAYFAKLDERLEVVNRELFEAIERSKALAMQVQTNDSPDFYGTMPLLARDNVRTISELQREQWYLEMKKLEFQALRGRPAVVPARP